MLYGMLIEEFENLNLCMCLCLERMLLLQEQCLGLKGEMSLWGEFIVVANFSPMSWAA